MDSYVIWRHGSGFFSLVAGVLGKLRLADELGAVPHIDLETHPTPYQQEDPVRGTRNVWEYYFQPVSKITREEAFEQRPQSWRRVSRWGALLNGEESNFPFDVGQVRSHKYISSGRN